MATLPIASSPSARGLVEDPELGNLVATLLDDENARVAERGPLGAVVGAAPDGC